MKLRAVEIALLPFLVFCLWHRGRAFELELFVPQQRGGAVAAVMLVVTTALHLARFARLKWAPGTERGRRVVWLTTGLLLVPTLFVAIEASRSIWAREWAQLNLEQWILLGNEEIKVLGLLCLPALLCLAFAIDAKQHPALDLKRLLVTNGTSAALALREWLPLIVCIAIYPQLSAIAEPPEHTLDPLFDAADRALFGGDPREMLEPFINVPLSEWMALSYTSYAVLIPLVTGAVVWNAGYLGLREISFTLGISLLIAYVSYILVPVSGPMLTRTFTVPLDLYITGGVKQTLMDEHRITWDCFPSVHTSFAVLLSYGAWRYARPVFWVTLPFVASIPFACVYLRYHYVVDVLAGLALAAFMIALSWKVRPLSDWDPARFPRTISG